jgi:F-type H+-transporting ATPase subunit b
VLIDWFTVAAQALNFLILVWLMKRFLYKPVLRAIDLREKMIAAELADADAKRREASQERAEFQHKNEVFDRERAALLRQATDQAEVERQRLQNAARAAADALTGQRQEALKNDARKLNRAIALRAQQEVFAIARKTLTELASTSLEASVSAVFTRRLRELSGSAKAGLADALKTAANAALVHSAFELPETQRTAIRDALRETFAADIQVRFESSPALLSGIELTAGAQKLEWTISGYLSALESGVAELLNEPVSPHV